MRINKEDTLALVIDYQEKLVPVMKNKDELVKNSVRLVKGLKTLEVPMIITEQYKKGLGGTIKEITEAATKLEKEESPIILDKISFSCAENEEFLKVMKDFNKKNMILCGIEAHICVLQTAIDLKELGYQVILVTNCIDSRKEEDKDMAINRAVYEGVILTTYESILFELTKTSNNHAFKTISNLIK